MNLLGDVVHTWAQWATRLGLIVVSALWGTSCTTTPEVEVSQDMDLEAVVLVEDGACEEGADAYITFNRNATEYIVDGDSIYVAINGLVEIHNDTGETVVMMFPDEVGYGPFTRPGATNISAHQGVIKFDVGDIKCATVLKDPKPENDYVVLVGANNLLARRSDGSAKRPKIVVN